MLKNKQTLRTRAEYAVKTVQIDQKQLLQDALTHIAGQITQIVRFLLMAISGNSNNFFSQVCFHDKIQLWRPNRLGLDKQISVDLEICAV